MMILTQGDIRKALPMDEVVEAMKQAYAALSAGQAEVPLRSRLPIFPHEGVTLIMPAFLRSNGQEALTIKVVSVYPHNVKRNIPIIHAAVLVLEADSGRPIALLEGGALTAIRTGAGAGAATDLLARPESHVAAIFGAGVQGRTQLEAICTIRPIQTVWVYDPIPEKVSRFIKEMSGGDIITDDLRAADTPAQAVVEADIICTATTSSNPVFADEYLKPGVHINGVGSYTPDMQEIPTETVARALVVVDSRSASLSEAGDLIQPIRKGIIDESHIHAEIGELVLGTKRGRTSPEQITFFKSVGVAVQDALAANLALKNAQEMGLGQRISW
ncbi:MAG: ornithine cyclodeaminase family protein [Chloroflexota bacterium]